MRCILHRYLKHISNIVIKQIPQCRINRSKRGSSKGPNVHVAAHSRKDSVPSYPSAEKHCARGHVRSLRGRGWNTWTHNQRVCNSQAVLDEDQCAYNITPGFPVHELHKISRPNSLPQQEFGMFICLIVLATLENEKRACVQRINNHHPAAPRLV